DKYNWVVLGVGRCGKDLFGLKVFEVWGKRWRMNIEVFVKMGLGDVMEVKKEGEKVKRGLGDWGGGLKVGADEFME
ncbi:hypothetical protein, partial [Bacillus velezensis]|uniref:hypothetical protein n=1 Tax=Bacillus velezensis TaxID=492670 RepID=UPI001C92E7F4